MFMDLENLEFPGSDTLLLDYIMDKGSLTATLVLNLKLLFIQTYSYQKTLANTDHKWTKSTNGNSTFNLCLIQHGNNQ